MFLGGHDADLFLQQTQRLFLSKFMYFPKNVLENYYRGLRISKFITRKCL